MSEQPVKEPPQKIDFNLSSEVNQTQREILQQLVEVMGVTELGSRVDRLETTQNEIYTKLSELVNAHNTLTTQLNGGATTPGTTTPGVVPTTGAPGMDLNKLDVLGSFLEKIFTVYRAAKGNDTPPTNMFGIDPNYIQEQIQASVTSNFEIGKAIQDNLKSKLMQKTMTNVLADAITHEPA